MKKIRAVVPFKDAKNDGKIRCIGEEFVEDDERASLLIHRGFATLVEDIVEKKIEVEQAVKEVKKEKAVREKKNAKK